MSDEPLVDLRCQANLQLSTYSAASIGLACTWFLVGSCAPLVIPRYGKGTISKDVIFCGPSIVPYQFGRLRGGVAVPGRGCGPDLAVWRGVFAGRSAPLFGSGAIFRQPAVPVVVVVLGKCPVAGHARAVFCCSWSSCACGPAACASAPAAAAMALGSACAAAPPACSATHCSCLAATVFALCLATSRAWASHLSHILCSSCCLTRCILAPSLCLTSTVCPWLSVHVLLNPWSSRSGLSLCGASPFECACRSNHRPLVYGSSTAWHWRAAYSSACCRGSRVLFAARARNSTSIPAGRYSPLCFLLLLWLPLWVQS